MQTTQSKQFSCSIPAKLILSGEHSVLYDCPALSMAVKLYTHCESHFTPSSTNSITIELSDFQQKHCFPKPVWQNLATDIEARYQLYLNQNTAIQSVLSKPVDLVLVTLHHFDVFHTIKSGNWYFKIHSEVPIGRGLGSSAGVIVGLLSSLVKHHDLDVDKETLLALARKIESRQHGQSSGIDPATILYGGLLEFHARYTTKQHKAHEFKAWLIDTGSPNSTTGQAVYQVKSQHGDNSALWKQFGKTTQKIIQAWSKQNAAQLYTGIRENQALLEQIGIVPSKVATFIQKLDEDYQAVAKVCGSGSVKGDNAGVLLCFSEQEPKALCDEYGYTCTAISVANKGATCQPV
ncbi:mevalonate kinase [Thiomicrorhabdus immobilis]|uniref:mevalonate kinase n=1 Tax=Thiomicrorhabdus immobilis TaxID=2791037 RepID=A0ABM7MER0_9GAMM|nr:hypothetical protein [Thiomicrorhabdus immobilis]BCN93909.1 mevalonate kinase [Thiomicrorhabdus immobilis]